MAVAPVYYRPKSFTLTEQYYKESVEAVATFNTRIRLERNARLPFIDSQTGLAQNSSSLWHPYRNRDRGLAPGQIYSYPSKRWKKKRRAFDLDYNGTRNDLETGASDIHQISAVENPAAVETPAVIETSETSKDKWYEEMDILSEPPDAGEIDDRRSDSSDYEESYVKRRKKKKAQTPKRQSRKKANKEEPSEFEDKEKPYSCEICGARYKTRPGLTYHLTHSHMTPEDVDEDSSSSQQAKAPTPTGSRESSRGTRSSSRNTTTTTSTAASNNNSGNGEGGNKQSSTNSYCDFCLGDEHENKKTGGKEELVSCGDCGRSGHPTCLQFTANMIISVKKYRWQCIECKSCGLCGTSDNDEQLLFCDDCDRGYHMYCLNPPLSEPPEGSWSCHLCIEEFYGGKKPPGMQ